MQIDDFLGRLRRVKKRGPNKWIASCPTREDKNPSLSIKLLDDGRILIHDFGGDSPNEILNAVGLSFHDLYPEPLMAHGKGVKMYSYKDILMLVHKEIQIVYFCALDVSKGKVLNQADLERLQKSITRLNYSMELASHER